MPLNVGHHRVELPVRLRPVADPDVNRPHGHVGLPAAAPHPHVGRERRARAVGAGEDEPVAHVHPGGGRRYPGQEAGGDQPGHDTQSHGPDYHGATATLQTPELVSKRLGNYQFHPVWDFIADQAWVR